MVTTKFISHYFSFFFMNHSEKKNKVVEIFDRLQKAGLSAKMVGERMRQIDGTLPTYPAMMSRLKSKDYKYEIERIDDYLRYLEEIERSLNNEKLPSLYYVGYFLDNDFQIRSTILEIWEDIKKIKLSFIGRKTVYREGFFQVNELDNSIAFTTRDDRGENHAFIITHDNGERLKDRQKMACVYSARFRGHKPVAGKMFFHQKKDRKDCEEALIPAKTAYQLYQKRFQTLSNFEMLDDTIEKIPSYIGVYKAYFFADKQNLNQVKVGIVMIQADGSIHFKLTNTPTAYTGIVKVSHFADNLMVGISWEKIGNFYRYNWVLERGNFFEDGILRGIYAGAMRANNRPVAGKLVLVKMDANAKYEEIQPYECAFEAIPFNLQTFFKGKDYPFIEQHDISILKEPDTRLAEIEGTYICCKLSANNNKLLCFPTKIAKNGEIIKKGEHESIQRGIATTFKDGAMLAITMQTEEKRSKVRDFFTHKLFFIGQHSYEEIQHITGVGTSVTNDEVAARCGREVMLTTDKRFEDLSFVKYSITDVPEMFAEVARYFGGKMDTLIIDSPSRVNKTLTRPENIGETYFHAACYNIQNQQYSKAKELLHNAYTHLFPATIAEMKEVTAAFGQESWTFLKEDADIKNWFGKYY